LAFDLHLGVKAGGVPGRAQALEVEHPSTVERAHDEPATAGVVQGLDFARDIDRRARSDVRNRHSSSPSEKRRA
jgi:hypothetical protein